MSIALFYSCMLSTSIDPRYLERFRQALYNLEGFDILGKSWDIDRYNCVISPTARTDEEDRSGRLGFIDDWCIERLELKKGAWNPSLSTLKSPYKRRWKPFTRLYSIGHRVKERPGGPRLQKRRRLTANNPWNGFIESYLKERRRNRLLESTRYQPTNKDVESVLLASPQFVQTYQRRQLEEYALRDYNYDTFYTYSD